MPSLTDDYAFMNFHFDSSLTSDAPKAIMLQNQSDHKNQHHQAASKHDMIHLGLIAGISRIFPDREIPGNFLCFMVTGLKIFDKMNFDEIENQLFT